MKASNALQRCVVIMVLMSYPLQQIHASVDFAISRWALVTGAILFSGLNVCIKMAIDSMTCLSHECCIDRSQQTDVMKDMIKSLRSNVFGQELAIQKIDNIIRRYQRGQDRIRNSKMFLFVGDIGTGKTYTASLMGHHLFPHGQVSQLIVFIDMISILDDNNNDYHRANQWLTDRIFQLSQLCYAGVVVLERWNEVSLSQFNIFDAIIKDTTDQPNRMKIRRMTFIFISTLGSQEINNATIAAYKNRLTRGTFPDRKLYYKLAQLIRDKIPQFTNFDNLFDIIIPFLPLQREHIKQCATKAISTIDLSQQMKMNLTETVANSVSYYGSDELLFAKWGCKRVYDILSTALQFD